MSAHFTLYITYAEPCLGQGRQAVVFVDALEDAKGLIGKVRSVDAHLRNNLDSKAEGKTT